MTIITLNTTLSTIEIFYSLPTVITRQLLKGCEIMYGVSIRKMIKCN